MKIRVGFGYDVHRLVEGRELWLGGIKLEHTLGLLGHSDADVLIHALCDALLGAANMLDIGCIVLVIINVIFVPQYGYVACAWAGLAGYTTCMLLSYFVGQRKNPIPYDLRSIGAYTLLAAILFVCMTQITSTGVISILLKTLLVLVYAGFMFWKEFLALRRK